MCLNILSPSGISDSSACFLSALNTAMSSWPSLIAFFTALRASSCALTRSRGSSDAGCASRGGVRGPSGTTALEGLGPGPGPGPMPSPVRPPSTALGSGGAKPCAGSGMGATLSGDIFWSLITGSDRRSGPGWGSTPPWLELAGCAAGRRSLRDVRRPPSTGVGLAVEEGSVWRGCEGGATWLLPYPTTLGSRIWPGLPPAHPAVGCCP
mmetsp:Transcript_31436/g.60609  ORF Transcript_31436/g.60609 Transcript_31436/m.60609 type:complete len:209 (-) Transcript_31436:1608-2234(-)